MKTVTSHLKREHLIQLTNEELKIYGENGFRFRLFAALIILVLVNSQLTTVYFIPQVEQI